MNIVEGLESLEIEDPGPKGDNLMTATVVLDSASLARPGVNLASKIQFFTTNTTVDGPLFTGFVDSLEFRGEQAVMRVVTLLHFLGDQKSGGLALDDNANLIEAAWSFTRTAGVEDQSLRIEGFELPPPEVFQVIIPVEGFHVGENISVGGVTLMSKNELVIQSVEGLELDELVEPFLDATCWAVAFPVAASLFDAENQGRQLVEIALALFRARLLSGFPFHPDGTPKPYRRSTRNANLELGGIVVVKGIKSGRRWLRGLHLIETSTAVEERLAQGCSDRSRVSVPLPLSISQALLAWSASSTATDPVRSIISLWEAVEFYASEVKIPKLFTKSERSSLLERALDGLNSTQGQRVKDLLDMLNSYSLRARLVAALQEDRFRYLEQELSQLWTIRTPRNKFGHGSAAELPSQEQLRIAISFVNRFLLHKVHRLQVGTS